MTQQTSDTHHLLAIVVQKGLCVDRQSGANIQ